MVRVAQDSWSILVEAMDSAELTLFLSCVPVVGVKSQDHGALPSFVILGSQKAYVTVRLEFVIRVEYHGVGQSSWIEK